LSKSCQKVVKKGFKKLLKSSQKNVKKLSKSSKSCQKVQKSVKKMSKTCQSCQKIVKKMSKGCQKIVNKKFGQKFALLVRLSGEEEEGEEEEEEDWWLLDHVATSSHLVKMRLKNVFLFLSDVFFKLLASAI
jgi:hypothetical protein